MANEKFGWFVANKFVSYEELKESMYPANDYADYSSEEIEEMMQKAQKDGWWDVKDGFYRELAEGYFVDEEEA